MKKTKIETRILEFLKRINFFLKLLGINLVQTKVFLTALPLFVEDYHRFRKNKNRHPNIFIWGNSFPCLNDRSQNSGEISGHYFYQDSYVARKIFLANPQKHLDIGSRIDGFISILAAFREVEVLDIRPLPIEIENVSFQLADIVEDLPAYLHSYCDSLSCLHTIEHLGLGRYGDPIDYDGYIKGLRNITKILKPNGLLYVSVPIGPQRIEFNAHRVFSVRYFLDLLTPDYSVLEFSYIDSDNNVSTLFKNVKLDENNIHNNFGCEYGCGIFIAKKKPQSA